MESPWKLVEVHGLFEWQGVDCPRCHTPISLHREQFKGGSSTTMHIRHLATGSNKCPQITNSEKQGDSMSEKTQEQKDADALVKKYGVPTWDHDCREHQDTLDGSPAVVESFGSAKFGAEGPAEDPYIRIKFQAGPRGEVNQNGCTIEDVIDVLVTRLEGFQKGPFRCRENALAITKLEEAKLWLSERTRKRQTQGVEGTMAAHT